MVKKLLKYEFKYYIRILLPVWLVLIGVAGVSRIIQFFETETIAYQLIFNSSVVTICLGALGSGILTAIISVIRFFKNIFSREGYLSLTLPVTTAQHITAKLLGVFTAIVGWALSVVAAIGVATAGEVFLEVVKAILYLCKINLMESGFDFILVVIGSALKQITAYLLVILVSYACISIAQTFRKGKVIGAVGLFFGFYLIWQIIRTVSSILFVKVDFFKELNHIITYQKPVSLAISIGINLLVSIGLLIIIKRKVQNKLNLE